MRAFSDLRLACYFGSDEELRRILERAACLGYRLVAIPLEPQLPRHRARELKAMASELGLDFVTRTDVRARGRNDLLSALRRLRRRFELIGVICQNKEIARVAARDRRVDLLLFPPEAGRRFFDGAEAELASSSNCALEIEIMPLFKLDKLSRIKLLAVLREEVAIAREYGVPIVISSGADRPILMRKPRELACLATFLGLSLEEALDAISNIPLSLVERNRAKLDPSFIAPGIRLVRKGDNCHEAI